MKSLILSVLALISLNNVAMAANDDAMESKLCGSIVVEYEYDLKWSRSEKRLLCGSRDTPSWQNIPPTQAEYLLRSFLQSRGYHSPEFSREGDILHVRPGTPTLIRSIRTIPVIPGLDLQDYWLPLGKPLSPEELNGIEKWITYKLGRLAYACPQLKSSGDSKSGDVIVSVDTGELWSIREVATEPIPYVRGGVLDRYRAFDIGDPYDPILLGLTANRMKASQAVINASLSPDCQTSPPGLIRQTTLPGQPRLVTFGFGFDSENLFIVKGAWRNSRLTETASLLDVSATASFRQQTVLTSFNWYYLPFPTRHYLKNYLRVEREYEASYETRSLKALSAPAWQRDVLGINFDGYVGPSLQFESSIRGDAPENARLLTIDAGINSQSHPYEYYVADPRSGYQFSLFSSFSNKSAASDMTLAHYKFDFTSLWNLYDFDPEIWILGLRGSFVTTQPGPGLDPNQVPTSFKQFLGGSEDMRGFARKALPRDDTGSLSKGYLGSEIRLNNILPYNLQPLLFVDWGWLGDEAFVFEPRTFWSPGIGLRWQSPIGTVRGSVGHGFAQGNDAEKYDNLSKFQFYFSLGEQF